MNEQHAASHETRKGDAVADLLHRHTGRTKGGRGNERAAVVVHNDADNEVDEGHHDLGDNEGLGVVARVAHLRGDREKGGGSGKREDNGRDGRHGLRESRLSKQLPVGLVHTRLWCSGRSILHTHGNREREHCDTLASLHALQRVRMLTSCEDTENTNPRDP